MVKHRNGNRILALILTLLLICNFWETDRLSQLLICKVGMFTQLSEVLKTNLMVVKCSEGLGWEVLYRSDQLKS